jgi:hypothetical protein
VTNYLLEEMDKSEFNKVYNKLNNPINIYKKNDIVDWNNRTVTRLPIHIGKLEETLNVISLIRRLKDTLRFNSKPKRIDRVELHFDINTYQALTEYRFDLKSFDEFINKAFDLEYELKKKYLELLNDE